MTAIPTPSGWSNSAPTARPHCPAQRTIHSFYGILTTGEQLQRLIGHRWWVSDVEFLPDGRRALSSSFDFIMILWDLETGQRLRDFEGHQRLGAQRGDHRRWRVARFRPLLIAP